MLLKYLFSVLRRYKAVIGVLYTRYKSEMGATKYVILCIIQFISFLSGFVKANY